MSDPTSRREFLQHTSGCLLGAMTAFGLPAKEMWALPVTITAGQPAGHEHSYPIPAADGISIDRATQVILVRYQGRAFAFALSCPHENAAVKWVDKEGRFQCTKHNSRYQPDGVYTSGRDTRNMDRFPIRRVARH